MPKSKIKDGAEMSFDEIAQELGLTRQGVEYIYHQAIKKLRKRCVERGIDLKDLLEG